MRRDSEHGGEGTGGSGGSKLEDISVLLDALLHHPQLIDHACKLRTGIGRLLRFVEAVDMLKKRCDVQETQVRFLLQFRRQFFIDVLIQECLGFRYVDSSALEELCDRRAKILMLVVHIAPDRPTCLLLLFFGERSGVCHGGGEGGHQDDCITRQIFC